MTRKENVFMFRCPHCHEEIDHAFYNASTSGWESGSAYINEDGQFDDHETNDSESNDTFDYEYRCPECDHSLSEDELEEVIEEGQEPAPSPTISTPPDSPAEITAESHHIIEKLSVVIEHHTDIFDTRRKAETETLIVCPSCKAAKPEDEYDNVLQSSQNWDQGREVICGDCEHIFRIDSAKRKTLSAAF